MRPLDDVETGCSFEELLKECWSARQECSAQCSQIREGGPGGPGCLREHGWGQPWAICAGDFQAVIVLVQAAETHEADMGQDNVMSPAVPSFPGGLTEAKGAGGLAGVLLQPFVQLGSPEPCILRGFQQLWVSALKGTNKTKLH